MSGVKLLAVMWHRPKNPRLYQPHLRKSQLLSLLSKSKV